MAKQTIQYICSSCGAKAPQLLGRCPVCGEWGTYEEEVVATASSKHTLSVSLGGHAQWAARNLPCPCLETKVLFYFPSLVFLSERLS